VSDSNPENGLRRFWKRAELGTAALSLQTAGALGMAPNFSGPGLLSVLRAVGMARGGPQAALALLAAAPATMAEAMVHWGFGDDPDVHAEERAARHAARTAGTVGALWGTGLYAFAVSYASKSSGLLGLTTGLKVLGAGRVLGGLVVAFGLPVVTAAAAAGAAYWLYRRRTRAA
jgi:hypothetical protein